MKTNDLIQALAADPPPPRLWSVFRRWTVWVALSAAGSALLLAQKGVRSDLAELPGAPLLCFDVLLPLAFALVAGAGALYASVPGDARSTRSMWLARTAFLLWALLLGARGLGLGGAIAPGASCAAGVVMGTIWPMAMLMWMARRAAPVQPLLTGALAGLAGAGWGAWVTSLHCSNNHPLHALLWHALPVAGLAGLAALAGGYLLRWRRFG